MTRTVDLCNTFNERLESVAVRMGAFGNERGSSRMRRLRGRSKQVYDQRVTGTICIYTLRYLLGVGAEQLWVLSECQDVGP